MPPIVPLEDLQPSAYLSLGPVRYRILSFPPPSDPGPITPPAPLNNNNNNNDNNNNNTNNNNNNGGAASALVSSTVKRRYTASLPDAGPTAVLRVNFQGQGDLYLLQDPTKRLPYPPPPSSSADGDVPYSAINGFGVDHFTETFCVVLASGHCVCYSLSNFRSASAAPALTFKCSPVKAGGMVRVEDVTFGGAGGGFVVTLNDYHMTRVTFRRVRAEERGGGDEAEAGGLNPIKSTMPPVTTLKNITTEGTLTPVVDVLPLKGHCVANKVTPKVTVVHPSGSVR